MCMKYINANVSLFKGITTDSNNTISLSNPFSIIMLEENSIKNFFIVSYITMMGSKNKDKSTLDRLEKLEVCIRLTKCTLNEDERISYDLDRFIIDPQDPTNIIHHEACVSYLNYKRITNIGKIEIGIPNPKGAYVIKVLVKEPAHEKFTIQSLNYMGIE